MEQQRVRLPLLDAREGAEEARIYAVAAWYDEGGKILMWRGEQYAPPVPEYVEVAFELQVLVDRDSKHNETEAAVVEYISEHSKPYYRLALLRRTVAAKLEYWAASRRLEIELGFTDDTPDWVDAAIENHIQLLAGAMDDPVDLGKIDASHLDDLLRKLSLKL